CHSPENSSAVRPVMSRAPHSNSAKSHFISLSRRTCEDLAMEPDVASWTSSSKATAGRRSRCNIQQRGCGAATIALPMLQNVEFALWKTEGHLLQEASF